MPTLSFIVFHDEVKDGKKRQTIRRNRKQPIKVGDTLYLYWHLRRKDCHLLRKAKCIETFTKPWRMLKVFEDIAKCDGVESATDMCEWFNRTQDLPDDKELFDVIRW
ncbi:hypothetical protein IMZ68_01895 [Candidatus Bathyarchaeota archaeon]|nr:hypothetical protein [Candidatus Bathyarchaeota archaeon]